MGPAIDGPLLHHLPLGHLLLPHSLVPSAHSGAPCAQRRPATGEPTHTFGASPGLAPVACLGGRGTRPAHRVPPPAPHQRASPSGGEKAGTGARQVCRRAGRPSRYHPEGFYTRARSPGGGGGLDGGGSSFLFFVLMRAWGGGSRTRTREGAPPVRGTGPPLVCLWGPPCVRLPDAPTSTGRKTQLQRKRGRPHTSKAPGPPTIPSPTARAPHHWKLGSFRFWMPPRCTHFINIPSLDPHFLIM